MQDAVALAAKYDEVVLCEEFIEGDELTCPVLGEGENARALPVIASSRPGAYDYQNKYFTDVTQYLVPAACRTTGARDPAHRRRGLPHARLPRLGPCRPDGARDGPQALPARDEHQPGMTSHSLVPMSAKAAGMSYEQLCFAAIAERRADG